jgi:hypothetical protein
MVFVFNRGLTTQAAGWMAGIVAMGDFASGRNAVEVLHECDTMLKEACSNAHQSIDVMISSVQSFRALR